ncbi:MAG TPA: hypothetical protein VF083_10450, partial [Acidimicrobiia bacterium]
MTGARVGDMTETHVAQVWEDGTTERRRFEFVRSVARNKLAAHTIALVVIFGAWEALVRVFEIRSYLLPSPSEVALEMIDSFPVLLENTWITLFESMAGFAMAIVVGIALAILLVYVPLLRGVVMPYLVAFNVVPKVAFAPLLIIWLGLGIESKIALSF